MDRNTNEDVTPDTPAGEEPDAAHFREAARLAAARVRAAMAEMPEETEEPEAVAETPPSAKSMEDAARSRARALAGSGSGSEAPDTADAGKSGKKNLTKRMKTANDRAAALLPEIDERLETGARMLRAFETQIERLERSARNAEEAEAASAPAPTMDTDALEAGVRAVEDRIQQAVATAETSAGRLEAVNTESNATAEALGGGLETATAVKELLEGSLRTLSEDATTRTEAVKNLLERADRTLETIESRLQRVEEVERSITDRLRQAEAAADRIERMIDGQLREAQSRTGRIEEASRAALGSVREHVANELSAISSALLGQATSPAPARNVPEPPLVEIETTAPIEPAANDAQEPEPVRETETVPEPTTERISHGTLSIDATAIRQTDSET